MTRLVAAVGIVLCVGCVLGVGPVEPEGRGAEGPPLQVENADGLKELLPGVRVGEGVVEFRGRVCADVSHPETPIVYLELLVTGPDSREHESLVVTTVRPSAVHAGMLAAGFEAGRPIRWKGDRAESLASGDAVRLEVAVLDDGKRGAFVDLASWAINEDTKQRLTEAKGWGLVFAGSLMDDRGYAADKTGTVVGLTGFGTEVIGASWGLSPTAAVDAPVWIVDRDRVAPYGREVVLRVTRAAEAKPKPGANADTPSEAEKKPGVPGPGEPGGG